jgi:outer membrane protein assembly factor BamB
MIPRALLLSALLCCPAALHAENWPQWRGPFGNGSTTETGLPDHCDPAKAAWSLALPGAGHATPIVWGKQVFLTSVDRTSGGVLALCVNADDGKVLWQQRIGEDAKAPRNNAATPSPVTDGKQVWFLLGSGRLAALDLAGKPRWRRDLVADHGNLCTKFGYSSSPLLWDGILFVQLLRRPKPYTAAAANGPPLEPLLLALDPLTGKELWKHARRSPAIDESCESYSTPVAFQSGDLKQLLVQGGDCLTAHNPASGAEIWRYEYNLERETNWRLIPSPVAVGELAVAMLPRGGPLVAIHAAAKGALAPSAVRWTYDERTSDSGSTLLYQNYLHILQSDKNDPWRRGSKNSPGIFLLVVDPATGKEAGRCQIAPGGAWRASPTGADGKIYLMSEEGEVVVVSAGPNAKILSRTALDEGPTCATITAADGRLFVRTAKRLLCFAGN